MGILLYRYIEVFFENNEFKQYFGLNVINKMECVSILNNIEQSSAAFSQQIENYRILAKIVL